MKAHLKNLWPAIRRRPIVLAALLVSALGAFYWLLLASDRYVSESHVIIQRTDLGAGQSVDFTSLLSGSSGTNKTEQLLLRDHLLSTDMLKDLEGRLKLREHYSDSSHDLLSRLWSRDAPIERFHRYYLSRVSVEFDEYTGVLVIKSQAYDRRTAHAITAALVQEGERFMNGLAHDLARSQVAFLERQVTQMADRAQRARQQLIEYQNRKGMVSPQAAAETLSGIVSRLQGQRAELETQRSALQGYLVSGHPQIVQIDQQIAAIDRQLAREQAKLTAPSGRALNRTLEEFQRLEMQATFAQDIYKTALTALESGRIEATRTLKQMSVIQSPTLPEDSLEPRRIYNSVVFTLVALLLAGVVQLLAAIVRDHKD